MYVKCLPELLFTFYTGDVWRIKLIVLINKLFRAAKFRSCHADILVNNSLLHSLLVFVQIQSKFLSEQGQIYMYPPTTLLQWYRLKRVCILKRKYTMKIVWGYFDDKTVTHLFEKELFDAKNLHSIWGKIEL